MTKHTPGPWEVHGPHDAPWVQSTNGPNGRSVDIVPRTMADARLIAAAPDMLAALRNAQTVLDDLANGWPLSELHMPMPTLREAIQDAIAKATEG